MTLTAEAPTLTIPTDRPPMDADVPAVLATATFALG